MKRIFISLAMVATSMVAGAQQVSPITQAMLDAYKSMLEEDPNDYVTYYQRGAQYYQLSMYDQALNDVVKALQLTPAKDKDTLLQEYTLLGNIRNEKGEYTGALEAVNAALELSPSDYALLYMKGNICLHLNNLNEARNSFVAMQRVKSRSQEALTGLAKVDILEGKYADAKTKMQQLEDLNSSSATTYCRLGDLYRDLNEPQQAAAQYLMAFALSDDNESRAMTSIFDLAKSNYNAVADALNGAISKTSNVLPLYFLKGNVEFENGHYNDAKTSFAVLLKSEDGKQAAVYNRMAQTLYFLNETRDALVYVNQALSMDAQPYNYITKAQIELALGNNVSALAMARSAYDAMKYPGSALAEMAFANIALTHYKDALSNLNEAIMEDAGNIHLIMVRGYLNSKYLKDERAAKNDYQRVAAATATSVEEYALKGMAQSLSGKQLDGASTLKSAETAALSPHDFYCLAVAYAQTGNLAKGREMLDNALALGYENIYNLKANNVANLNIAPLR